jgi:hypothetical protein
MYVGNGNGNLKPRHDMPTDVRIWNKSFLGRCQWTKFAGHLCRVARWYIFIQKNPTMDGLGVESFVYIMNIWYILCQFEIFYDNLLHLWSFGISPLPVLVCYTKKDLATMQLCPHSVVCYLQVCTYRVK